MDVYIPKIKEWTRVDMELVRADNKARMDKRQKSKGANKLLFMTCGSGDEDPEGGEAGEKEK